MWYALKITFLGAGHALTCPRNRILGAGMGGPALRNVFLGSGMLLAAANVILATESNNGLDVHS